VKALDKIRFESLTDKSKLDGQPELVIHIIPEKANSIKEELESVERRAKDERDAHNATKMAAMEKEVELEHRALDASTALAKIHAF
ncbi:hypothetical protein Tco_1488871, partial [Tanacetum coccineum]